MTSAWCTTHFKEQMIDTRTVHIRLLAFYQKQLADGTWKPGDRFPSMRELAAQHGVSQTTAGKILAKLASEGWLETRHGSGSYVADRPSLFAELRQMDSFTDFARANALTPQTDVLACEIATDVPAEYATALGLDGRSKIIYIERLRRLNGQVVIHEARWLPAKRYPGLQAGDLSGSFHKVCRERYQLTVEREDAKVRAVATPPNCRIDAPACLQFTGLGYDASGAPIWVQLLHYHGECFEIQNSAESTGLPRLRLRLNHAFAARLSR